MQSFFYFGNGGQLGGFFDFVDFVGQYEHVFSVFEQGIKHFEVGVGGADKGVDDQHNFLLLDGRIEEVAIDDFFDGGTLDFGDFGIAVAGQVDQVELVVDQEDIDLTSATGKGTGFCQAFDFG